VAALSYDRVQPSIRPLADSRSNGGRDQWRRADVAHDLRALNSVQERDCFGARQGGSHRDRTKRVPLRDPGRPNAGLLSPSGTRLGGVGGGGYAVASQGSPQGIQVYPVQSQKPRDEGEPAVLQ
jgi:hypothetical protein